jgi:DNA-binding response OmpR family regulator
MHSQKLTKILVITNDDVVRVLYYSVLEQYSLSSSNFSEAYHHSKRFAPHLVILHFDDEFQVNISEFLKQISQTRNETEHPLILLIVPKDWFEPSLEELIDTYLTSPVAPVHLLETVQNLLRKSSVG